MKLQHARRHSEQGTRNRLERLSQILQNLITTLMKLRLGLLVYGLS